MSFPYKFGWIPNEGEAEEFFYSNEWAEEKTKGPSRLIIARRDEQIALITDLVRAMEPPFSILHVLLVPRSEDRPGRYEHSQGESLSSVESFLTRFKDYFEQDARSHLWIRSSSDGGLLVYDRHNVIYAYGNLPAFENILARRQMTKVDTITFPSPHVHPYRKEFDDDAAALLEYWPWMWKPLRESDDC
jgi:hypothetical protein